MKIFVLGGNGMAGHMIVDYLKRESSFQVHYTSRKNEPQGIQCDATNFNQINQIIKEEH